MADAAPRRRHPPRPRPRARASPGRSPSTRPGPLHPGRHALDPAALLRADSATWCWRGATSAPPTTSRWWSTTRTRASPTSSAARTCWEATPLHRLLQALLGLPVPVWHHHRLIRDEAGRRLAKRDDARSLATLRGRAGPTPATRHSRAWRGGRGLEPRLRRLGQDDLLAVPHRGEEAARPVGVAGRAGLVDDQQQAVAVAVDPELDQPLDVARGRALAPELAARARPVGDVAGPRASRRGSRRSSRRASAPRRRATGRSPGSGRGRRSAGSRCRRRASGGSLFRRRSAAYLWDARRNAKGRR